MIPLIIAGLAASTAASMYASSKQAEAKKAAAKSAAASATPSVGTSQAPAAYQPSQQQFRMMAQPQSPTIQAPQAQPFTPTQVVTAPAWNAQAPGGGAAMPTQQPAALQNNWASDYSKGMAGAGAPDRPNIASSWGAL
jgi:hypothetical protein